MLPNAWYRLHERFSGGASVRTWLVGILKHKVRDQFRRQVREVQLEDPDDAAEADDPAYETDFAPSGHWRNKLADWGNPEETLERGEFITFLQRCLDALPKRLGQLFWLREVMEEDTATICKESLRLHLWMCVSCRRFERQLAVIRQAMRLLRGRAEAQDAGLTPEARERIRRALAEGPGQPPD